MTFPVNHDGVVYERDPDPGTAAAAQELTRVNPDKGLGQSVRCGEEMTGPAMLADRVVSTATLREGGLALTWL